MPKRSLALLIAMSSWRAAALTGQDPKVATDSAQMQGTWVMVSGATSGTPVPAEFVREMRRVASGKEVTVTWGKEVFFQATITLHPAANPKAIDYRLTGGANAGGSQLGIYSIAGDTLRFCFAAPGSPRPPDFTTVADDGRILSNWIRAKQ